MDAETWKALGVVAMVTVFWLAVGCYAQYRDRKRDAIARRRLPCYCELSQRDCCAYRYTCGRWEGHQ